MAITAKLVKELREQTGAGMMECKKALVETEGDLKKAAEYLQIKGIAKAAKKADRVAAEGTIGAVLAADGKSGAMLEVNCETDFVARNEEFGGLVAGLTEHVLSSGVTDAAALLETDFNGQTVDEYRKSKIASTGENITLRRAGILALAGEGAVNFYRHNGGAIGVLVGINAGSSVEGNAAVAELARDIAMHVAAENPEVTDSSELAEEIVADKTRIEVEKAMESGKPEEIAKKMVIGRINKWKKEISLLDQKFVKNPDLSVAEHVAAVGKEQGLELSVAGFERFVCGEGIEKVESNLADEVAALAK